MANVFDLEARITLDKSGYESGVNEARGSFSRLASGVGAGLKTVGKIGAAAISAGVAGVAALTKMGVEGYAQYEQLVGGVETLFKKSGDVVKAYAENAYKTSGLSANAYMETVTSFSASLIKSLDGDTAKAAEVADMAITDMSDNANKMGTSIEMIQNAYNGFAKGNFTMLDNLKLGYGGTQKEMERLLKDAQKISGVKYDISSFADITEAIHVMQKSMEISGYSVDELADKLANAALSQEEVSKVAESMGISYEEAFQRMKDGALSVNDANALLGTTAREAATTIEGSLSMMKGAWQNLVVGMADENANMEQLITNFVDSTITVADNIMPRIEQTIAGIGRLVEGLAPIIAEKLPAMVESLLPSLLNAAVSLVTSVFGAFPGLLDSLLPVAIAAITTIVESLLPSLLDSLVSLVTTVFAALPGLLNSLLPVAITAVLDVLMAIVGVINENGGMFLQTGFDAILQLVGGLAAAIPDVIATAVNIIVELVNTLTSPESLASMLNTAMLLIENIVNGLIGNLPMLVGAAIQLVQNLVDFITEPGNLEKLLNMAVSLVMTIMNGLVEAIPMLYLASMKLMTQLVGYLLDPANIGMLIGAALSIVLAIVGGLIKSAVEIGNGVIALINEMVAKFEGKDWKEVANDIIDDLLDGLKDAWDSVANWFSSVWDSLFDKDVNVSADSNGNVTVKGTKAKTGLNYVPYDDFPAILHRGEAVLTSAEARVWRKGQATPAMAGGVTINQYIQSVPQSPVEMAAATEAYFEQSRWML